MTQASYLIIFLILISVSITSVSAQESLLPSWIKTIAGFWANDQISDEEFVGALQFLVKEGILEVPSEETQIDPPSLELKSGPSDSSLPPSVPQKITPRMEAAWLQTNNLLILISLSDNNGNTIASSGQLTLKFLDENENELFSEKKYITADVFKERSNNITGETLTAIQYNIAKSKFRATDWTTGWYHGYEDVDVKIIFEDTSKTSHTNEFSISHLPFNEGFFAEDTGFVKTYESNEGLNVGPFFIKIPSVGPYMATIDGRTNEYFRVNLETQYKQISDVSFVIDEMYILDDKNNMYSPEEDSFSELRKAFIIDNGFILFEEIPSDPSKITIFLKITVIELDSTDTPYDDSAEIILR